MKGKLHSKLSAAILALVMLCALAPVTALAAGDVAIDETNFPDGTFRKYVKQFDTDKNGTLSTAEIGAFTVIGVSEKGISSLKGIEYFTALKKLSCDANNLTSLDVSKNTALEELDCSDNRDLTSLNVSGCTALTKLDCCDTQLTELDVSGCIALTELQCGGWYLESLDASGCTALTELDCVWTSDKMRYDQSNCTAYCYSNNLRSLDVSGCTALTKLYCKERLLTELDASNCTALEKLYCKGNYSLTSLDVSGCTALEVLDCSFNSLTSLDVSDCTALTELYCVWSDLTSLDVRSNTALEVLSCDDTCKTRIGFKYYFHKFTNWFVHLRLDDIIAIIFAGGAIALIAAILKMKKKNPPKDSERSERS